MTGVLALIHHREMGWTAAQRPPPSGPTENQVLVRIRAVGICGTDLGIHQGLYDATPGVVLGHEAAGEVVATGTSRSRLTPGTRVAIDPTYFCGECRMCRTGRPNHCAEKRGTETGVTRDGCFTDLYLTEERFLYPLPDHVSYSEATFAEPLSCVLTGLNRLRLRPGLRTVVLGGGPIGALYAAALALRGIGGTIVETAPIRRGVLGLLALPGWQVSNDFPDPVEGELDVVVDTTSLLGQRAVETLACGGQLLLVGLKRSQVVIDPGKLADRSISVVGSIDSIDTFSDALALISSKRISVAGLVTHTMPLAGWQTALSLLGCGSDAKSERRVPEAMKIILLP